MIRLLSVILVLYDWQLILSESLNSRDVSYPGNNYGGGWGVQPSVHYQEGHFNTSYNGRINSAKLDIYSFTYNASTTQETAVRISTSTQGNKSQYPVMFVIKQEKAIVAWQIPLVLQYEYHYYQVERSLCPDEGLTTKGRQFYVEVSTMFESNITYELHVDTVENFNITTEQTMFVKSSPPKPVYYKYTFPEGVSKVLVTATSNDSLCMILSVQGTNCPVFDLERNVDYAGMYQTMSKQGAIAVEESFGSSFYVAFIVMGNDQSCLGDQKLQTLLPAGGLREKSINIRIRKTIQSSQYYIATLAAAAVFVAFYIVALFLGCFYHACKKDWGIITLGEQGQEETDVKRPMMSETGERRNYGTAAPISQEIAEVTNYPSSSSAMSREVANYPTSSSAMSREVDNISVDSLNSNDYDLLKDANEDKYVIRTKTSLMVRDLAMKSEKKVSKNYRLYSKNLITISVFYGLPVLQLVLTYQQVLNVTGNQDICYYNFDCANPFMQVTSFNNIYSNIGYVLLGILFLIIVARRAFVHQMAINKSAADHKLYGIPQHYGLFYGMGFALVMEGFMSACYHVCPTVSNFQFDTSFMYIMSCLCILKIYQNRHPDISAKAHSSYLFMALVIIVAVVGVVYGTNVFWIFFALIYIFVSLLLSIHLYYLGQWQLDRYIFRRLWLLIRTDWLKCSRPLYCNRLVLLLLGNLVNWSIAIYGAVTGFQDFASFLLGIFICNLLLYSIFYIVMKLLSREKIPILTWLLIIASGVFWCVSLYFFTAHLTSWELTPAQSREGNKACIVLDFYDAHDVWHFLSAISLFLSFLVLLTMDDELVIQKRDRIPVF